MTAVRSSDRLLVLVVYEGAFFCYTPASATEDDTAKFELLLPASGCTNCEHINFWGTTTASAASVPGFYTFAADGLGSFVPIPFAVDDPSWVIRGINDCDSCVGYKGLAGGIRCAVLYTQASGIISALPWLKNPGRTPQGSAAAINNNGQVVGYSSVTNGNATHAFRYTPTTGKMEDLGVVQGYWNTQAWSINNKSEGNGDVVGVMSDGRGVITGFLYTDKTGMIDLKTTIVGGWPSALNLMVVNEINDEGYIIGRIDNRACRLVPQ